jgi:integrase
MANRAIIPAKHGALRAPDGVSAAESIVQARNEADYDRARDEQDASVPENTRRAYELELHCYASWCDRRRLVAVPADPHMLVVYIRELAHQGRDPRDVPDAENHPPKGPMRYGSVMRALGAICRAHLRRDFPSPWGMQCLVEAREALARELGTRPNQKLPMTRDVLRAVVDKIPAKTLLGKRDRAMILFGERVAARRSEVAGACVEHFRVETNSRGEKGLVWLVPKSKTDQGGEGQEVPIMPDPDPRYCCIAAIRDWTRAAGITSGPLFRVVDARGVGESAITPETVSNRVKARIEAAGYDPAGFAGHSLRAGRITTLAQDGEPDHQIRRISRHESDRVLRGYIRRAHILDDVPGQARGKT